jgi:acyl-CoA reductase-like NAD-dependent aldehyde dehydrogenase
MTDVIEAPAAVKPINHWISGARYAGESGRTGAVYNPATGQQTGAVDFASVEEVDRAVQAAKTAFPAWRAMSLAKRAELFFRIRELVHEHREEIARFLTAEHGKVLSDAMGEVTRGLEVIEFCCGLPHLLKGGMSEQASTSTRSGSRSAWSAASRRSTSPRWFPCGCGRRRSRAATRSCSSRPRRIRPRRPSPPSC